MGAATGPATVALQPAGGLIVADDAAELQPGQMRQTDFLAHLRAQVCAAAERELAASGRSTDGCPYLDRWFGYYANRDPADVERAIVRYAPETSGAGAASEYVGPIVARVSSSVRTWATTGQVSGLPEGISVAELGVDATVAAAGEAVSEAAGSVASGIQSAAGAVAGAVSSAAGGVAGALGKAASVLFKRRSSHSEPTVDPEGVRGQLHSGRPLDAGVRRRMEYAFGESFGPVRIHTDQAAGSLASELGARAFTVGSDVAFAAGEYRPGSLAGDALIAHELAHTVQQRGGSGQPGGALEADADQAAFGALSQGRATVRGGTGLALQRCKGDKTAPTPAPPPYSRRDLVAKVEGPETAVEVATWVRGLPESYQSSALTDLYNLHEDYMREVTATPDKSDALSPRLAKIQEALETAYASVALTAAPGLKPPSSGWTDTGIPAKLLVGTHTPTAAERTKIAASISPVVASGGVLPTLHNKDQWASETRARVREWIDENYADVVGQGTTAHADPTKLHPRARIEEIAKASQREVDAVFGSYRRGAELKFGTTLFDRWEEEDKLVRGTPGPHGTRVGAMSPADRRLKAKAHVQYALASDGQIQAINAKFGAVPDRAEEAGILETIANSFAASDEARLIEILRGWPGAEQNKLVYLQLWKAPTDDANRRFFWYTFEVLIHEYVHVLMSDKYESYVDSNFGESDPRYNTLIEGVDSLLTETVWTNVVSHLSSPALRVAVEGPGFAALPFKPDLVPEIRSEVRYPSFGQALALANAVGIRNLYAAFFLGRVDLIQ